ncbi:MAG: hypothetical protein AB1938_32085 [Myxococcota bacterium]
MTPLLLLTLAASPDVRLENVDSRGCGDVIVDGRRVQGAAPGLCVVQAVWTPLEEGLLALLVRAPHRFDSTERLRVFVYRLVGRRLSPRFLGSGFTGSDVTRLVTLADALGVEVVSDAGVAVLRCVFDGFPLVCQPPPG